MRTRRRIGIGVRGICLVPLIALSACVTNPMLVPPPPYAVLPVDETMSCDAIAGSFRFAARRAARLEYWLEVGPLAGYGYERFPVDAPRELFDERRRLDALSDLQRVKGCRVMEPAVAVMEERHRLEDSARSSRPPVVINSKG